MKMDIISYHKINNWFFQYLALTKPRVTQLAVFCSVIGMFLASPELPEWKVLLSAIIGIWLLAGAAFAVNCLVEREIDARMTRTSKRPIPCGDISVLQTLFFSGLLGGLGMWILYNYVNPLTMWLTFVTFLGYAVVYTIILKPLTPQNIVIGGLSGAMPPALGWAAIANEVPMEAWLLVLIIFTWTPPHFWSLALYKREDYKKSGLPMLPNTHGTRYTGFQIFLYTITLFVTSLLPYVVRMSGIFYLACAMILGFIYLFYAWHVWLNYSDKVAKAAFKYSIIYLSLLFASLLVDHYLKFSYAFKT
tara:strand:- start:100 stop:1014 length:915 start_codon:yes stop_codon:yes gene_type:complete